MNKVISRDGTAIAYDRSGEGAPLILVDGALCYRSFGPMGPLAAQLAPHFTVITYDRRGRGDSGDTQPYAVVREIEDIKALIDEVGGAAFVYGISSGAALALEAARSLPGKVRKLALYEPPFMSDSSNTREAEEYREQLGRLVAADRRDDALVLFMRRVGGLGVSDDSAEVLEQMRNAPMWPLLRAIAPTLVYDAAILGDGSVPRERAASVNVPALVIAGGASPSWMRDAAQATASALPNGKYRTLEGQTHEVAAEALAPVLVEFFSA